MGWKSRIAPGQLGAERCQGHSPCAHSLKQTRTAKDSCQPLDNPEIDRIDSS